MAGEGGGAVFNRVAPLHYCVIPITEPFEICTFHSALLCRSDRSSSQLALKKKSPRVSTNLRVSVPPRAAPLRTFRAPSAQRSDCPLSRTTAALVFIKQRRNGLNSFIQRVVSDPHVCQHPDVQAFLQMDHRGKKRSQPAAQTNSNHNLNNDSDTINLGPSANPQAKTTDFDFLKVIGKGSFGKVLLAKHKTDGKFYAVKVLQKSAILKRREQKHIMAERNVLLKNVKHPFLVGLHFSFQTADKLYFILDYVNGGELFLHLQRERCFSEQRARFYAAEIASAIGHLHSLNIVYRDLKPENILLDSKGHIVLTDFGLCKEGIEPKDTTSTFCGTPEYLAPEVLQKLPYDRTVDWWCLGSVLYEMIHGLPPFYSRNTAEMYDSILHRPVRFRPGLAAPARDVLERLLHKEKHLRLGAVADFLEIKNHAFFSSINWDDLYARRITPPYNPDVAGPSDLRHFDPEFVREPVPNSVGRSPDPAIVSSSVVAAGDAFLGFSYAPSADDTFL
ncbi:serine/threonine-protein kinase Sgk2-like isoform X2 [Petromyzon marinus]|uniref:non-specific serine/threonine protein kinase n=1 Tax=Petromyzon marinus TaxID=7757 RepID=A0AAJ7UGV5_PETMA|nr:serine/threonine-protein kinase Sgk1-like isoform X2 [Petromyzon marinus]